MKKFVFILFIITFFILIFSSSNTVFASDSSNDFYENTYEIIDEIDTSSLEEIFKDNQYFNSIQGATFKEKLKTLVSQSDTNSNFLQYLIKSLILDISKFLPFFIVLFIIAVLSGMIETIKPDGKSMQMSNIIYLVCYLCAVALILGQFIKTTQQVTNIITNVSHIMQVVMPLMLSFMSVSGMASSVAIYRPIVLVLSNSLVTFVVNILLPLITGITIINIITQITDRIKFNKLREVLSSLFKWIIGLSLTIFSFFLSVKGIYSSKSDGITLSAIKYLTGQVPVVGGFLREGTDIFIASTMLIKNAIGKMAVFILFWELLSPALAIIVIMFGLNIVSAICEPFADSKIVNCYSSIAKTFGNLLAIVLMSAFMFILTLILLITSGSAL